MASTGVSVIKNASEFHPDSTSDPSTNSGDWDLFLENSEYGHFQQSSCWADFKGSQGWQAHRYIDHRSGSIRGGFQILCKTMRIGTLCYISKGPVIEHNDAELLRELLEIAVKIVSEKKFPSLIVQLPDRCTGLDSLLRSCGFIKMPGKAIINATAVIDLNHSLETIRANFRQTTRKNIRQALRRGVTVREGSQEDLNAFFSLMAQTCLRQKTKPNPANPEELHSLWSAFSKRGKIRLTLAEDREEIIAGLLCIGFGKRFTFWKKGSNPGQFNTHAMPLLYWEALEWAKENGYKVSDFFALKRRIASKLLSGTPLSQDEKKTKDMFNLGFGITPEVLPSAHIWLKNRLLRSTGRMLSR